MDEQQVQQMRQEYQEELDYYKDTGTFTSSFTLQITMVFIDVLLERKTLEEVKTIEVGGEKISEDVVTWKRAFKELKEIEEKVKEFSEKCWPDINQKHVTAEYTTFQFTSTGLGLLSMATAGRILMTVRSTVLAGSRYISLIGAEAEEKVKPCGLQGIHAKKDEALELIDSIVADWDPEKFIINKSENVTIC